MDKTPAQWADHLVRHSYFTDLGCTQKVLSDDLVVWLSPENEVVCVCGRGAPHPEIELQRVFVNIDGQVLSFTYAVEPGEACEAQWYQHDLESAHHYLSYRLAVFADVLGIDIDADLRSALVLPEEEPLIKL